MLKPREQAKLGNGIGRSYDKAQASYDRCVSTQRTAASASNPIIQRAILFEPERVPVSPFFRWRFPHLSVGNSGAGNRERLFHSSLGNGRGEAVSVDTERSAFLSEVETNAFGDADRFSESLAHRDYSELGPLIDSRNATASSRVVKLPSE